jgi:hypothetical protein
MPAPLTAEQGRGLSRAPAGGAYAENGEFYAGGTFYRAEKTDEKGEPGPSSYTVSVDRLMAYLREQGIPREHTDLAADIARRGNEYFADQSDKPPTRDERTVYDIISRAHTFGRPSDAQVRFLATLLERIANPPAPGPPVPAGRQEIAGTVASGKWHATEYGETFKIILAEDRGFRVWLTAPAAILAKVGDAAEIIGRRVRLTATLEPGNEQGFGFGSRPSRATLETA